MESNAEITSNEELGRKNAPGGWHATKGPRVPRRACNRREYKRRKRARKMQRRRNR